MCVWTHGGERSQKSCRCLNSLFEKQHCSYQKNWQSTRVNMGLMTRCPRAGQKWWSSSGNLLPSIRQPSSPFFVEIHLRFCQRSLAKSATSIATAANQQHFQRSTIRNIIGRRSVRREQHHRGATLMPSLTKYRRR